ncbi:MAG: hypothetical protein WBA35_08255, partial [Litorimonas sp.]
SSPNDSDPDYLVFRRGAFTGSGRSGAVNVEVQDIPFEADTYFLEAYEFLNIDQSDSNDQDTCYTIRAQ